MNPPSLNEYEIVKAMLAGAILVSAWAISLFFLRFWRKTRDPLFAYFGAAFLLLGLERVSIVVFWSEVHSFVFLVRLFAFLLIGFAIVDKNRRSRGS